MDAILRNLMTERDEELREAQLAAWSLQQKLKLVEADNEQLVKDKADLTKVNAMLVTTLAGVEKRKARAV